MGNLVANNMNIPLARPDISEQDIQAVVDVLKTHDLSLGPKLSEFEKAFCQITGARYAVAVNSGTAALHLAVKSLGIGPGDEVITTPFSFVASANCILFERGQPVFVDIDPATFNINPELIEQKVTGRTKAILPVHVFGRPAHMDSIMEIARKYGLAVIEDACEALGAFWKDSHVGSIGDIGTFAFYPNKQITTGEGGILVTHEQSLATLCKSLRNQGRDSHNGWLQHPRLGFNYRIGDMNCALGISQLKRISDFRKDRERVATLYRYFLEGIEEIKLPAYQIKNAQISWFVYVIQLKNSSRQQRDRFLRYLREHGIACSDYFSPIHLQPYFRKLGYSPGDFPLTEKISESTVALPFFYGLKEDQIQYIADAIRQDLYEQGLTQESSHTVHSPVL